MCVYAIVDMKSFEVIPQYVDLLTRIKESHEVPEILVGNKADLPRKVVSKELAKDIAKQSFFETSALSLERVEKIFYKLLLEIRCQKERRLHKHTKENCCIVL